MLSSLISVLTLTIGTIGARPAQLSTQPLHFIENCGQWDACIAFAARCRDGAARIERHGFVFAAHSGACVRLSFEGASEAVVLEGREAVRPAYSFFIGRDPERWRGGVPAHRHVRAVGLYEGIDVEYREGAERRLLEYDLYLEDPAGLDRVVVRCEGATGLELEPDGALRIRTESGDLRQTLPRTWQIAPDGEQRTVECRYRIIDGERFGFEARLFDAALPMVIDPAVEAFSFVGTGGTDRTISVATSGDSDVYAAGMADDALGFSVPAGNCAMAEGEPFGGRNALVARFSRLGELQAVAVLGGTLDDEAAALHVHPELGVSVCGYTSSSDFPATNGSIYQGGEGFFIPGDGFVARLSLDLCSLSFATFLGGTRKDLCQALGVNAKGHIVVLGITASPDFPPPGFPGIRGAFQEEFQGGAHDVTLSVIDPKPGAALEDQLVYFTFLGGRDSDANDVKSNPENELYGDLLSGGLSIDGAGRVAITGLTRSPDFPTTPGAFQNALAGGMDAWAAILVPDLDLDAAEQLSWSTLIGGQGYDASNSLSWDAGGGVWIAGQTFSSPFPVTLNALQSFAAGSSDAFLAHLNPALEGRDQLVYSTHLGGNTWEFSTGVAVTPDGAAVVAGDCTSEFFRAPKGALQAAFGGVWDGFLMVLDEALPAREQVRYATYVGGTGEDGAEGFFFDGCAAWLGGETWSLEFASFPGITSAGGRDGYVLAVDLRLPRADFTLIASGCEITLDAAKSTTPDGTRITSYSWDLGDSVPLEGASVVRAVPPGRHTVTLCVTNDLGLVSTRSEVVSCGCSGSGDAATWQAIDIGEPPPAIAGSFFSGAEPGAFDVCAGGRGITGTGDGFHFAYQELTGDGTLVARLTRLEGQSGAPCGLMLRESLEPGARHAALVLQNGTSEESSRFVYRPTADRGTLGTSRRSDETPQIPDAWVKLERSGNTLIGSLSSDGSDWSEVARIDFDPPLSPLPSKLYGGVCAAGLDRDLAPFRAVEATVTDLRPAFGPAPVRFRRGDCNDDGTVDISDAVCILTWLFLGGATPGCAAATNTNGDAGSDIADATYLLNHLFLGGLAPVAPYPDCGPGTLATDEGACATPPLHCAE